jgi:hypothetical protein
MKWFNAQQRPQCSNSTWFTTERYKMARLLANFSQTILVQKYLPYIPKNDT